MQIRRFRLLLCVALVCAAVSSAAPGAGMAQTKGSTAQHQLYLPMALQHIVPTLIAPSDRQQTVSLAPILSWEIPITGTIQIQVSPDSAFPPVNTLPLSETKELQQPGAQQTLLGTNLAPATTFYWRAGIRTPAGYEYAPTRSFTTPPKALGPVPAAVPLVAPGDQAILPGTSATLQWQDVPTALYYRVRVYDANGALFEAGSREVQGPTNSLNVTGLLPGMSYTWKVKALNMYGWGEYGTIYHFTTP